MRAALGPDAHEGPAFPWSADPALQSSAPRADATAPDVLTTTASEASGARRFMLRVRSTRGARTLAVRLPPGSPAHIDRVNGVEHSGSPLGAGWTGIRVSGVPDDGAAVELVASDPGPIDVTILDETRTLPPLAVPVAAARPPWCTATQRGDVTVVSRRVRL
jgi:hypothetical protein